MKKVEKFMPELDGEGPIKCPTDAKVLKRLGAKHTNSVFADKLRDALKSVKKEQSHDQQR